MKRCNSRLCLVVVAIVFALLNLPIQAHAATGLLNAPRGLAIDSRQNLYVANQNGNNILVYNSSYVHEMTITANVSQPSGVAVDTIGNIYVLNRGNNSVTVYRSTGAEYPSGEATFTSGIENPWGIALDGLNNLYISNDFSSISVYVPLNPIGQSASGFGDYYPAYLPTGKYATPYGVLAVAAHGPFVSWGSTQMYIENVAAGLLSNVEATLGFYRYGTSAEALALAYDTKGNLYIGDSLGNLQVLAPNKQTPSTLVNVGFAIEGIAVDTVHGHIYLSNQTDNQIAVYSMSGALVTVLQ